MKKKKTFKKKPAYEKPTLIRHPDQKKLFGISGKLTEISTFEATLPP